MIPGPADLLSAYFVSIGETAGPIPDMWASFLRTQLSDATGTIPDLENQYLREILNQTSFTSSVFSSELSGDVNMVDADTWDLKDGVIAGGQATLEQGKFVRQVSVMSNPAGRSFEITIDIESIGGELKVYHGDRFESRALFTTSGVQTQIFTSSDTDEHITMWSEVGTTVINSMSMKEVFPILTSTPSPDLWRKYLEFRGFTGGLDKMAETALAGEGLLLGAVKNANPGFVADTDWAKVGGTAIASGVATLGNSDGVNQAASSEDGKLYFIQIDLDAGALELVDYGGETATIVTGTNLTTTGHKTLKITASAVANLSTQCTAGQTATIDNFEVREILS